MRILFPAAWLLLAAFFAGPASGQLPTFGQVFGLQSASGTFLSATGAGETLGMAPHLSGWEQWQYVEQRNGPVLQSFHGSVLAVLAPGKPIHTADFESVDKLGDEVQNVRVGLFKGAKENEIALYIVNVPGYHAMLVASGSGTGSIVLPAGGPITNSQIPIPAGAKWKVVPVPSPYPGRQPLHKGVFASGTVTFRSSHGTYLVLGAESKVVQHTYDLGFAALSGQDIDGALVRLAIDGRAPSPNVKPLHFGESAYIAWAVPGGSYLARPSTLKQPSGQSRAEAARSPESGSQTKWQILDPTGRFKIGDRVQRGVPVVIRNVATGQHLSADPGLPSPGLSPNTAGWEQWLISP